MNETYECLEMEVITFKTEDIIITSGKRDSGDNTITGP